VQAIPRDTGGRGQVTDRKIIVAGGQGGGHGGFGSGEEVAGRD